MELLDYFKLKGWRWKRSCGENVVIEACPYCKNTNYNLSFHVERQVFRCWACGASGNIVTLQLFLGDDPKDINKPFVNYNKKNKIIKNTIISLSYITKMHNDLMHNDKALRYLTRDRGLTFDTLKHFLVGHVVKHGKPWVVIPHFEGNQCVNLKMRSIPPSDKDFRRYKGGKSILFNSNIIPNFFSIVMVEAEFDAMSLWQVGIKNVIALTCGANVFKDEWVELFYNVEELILCLDNDKPGDLGAKNIEKKMNKIKCTRVTLPCKDANDTLVKKGRVCLKKLFLI